MSVAAVALLAACSSTPSPPAHAGTLRVHAVFAAGPEGPGVNPTQGPIAHTRIRITARNGASHTAKTDDRRDATFVLAPGVYVARLADLQGFDGKGGDLDCGGGAEPATVTVPGDGTVQVSLACWGEG